MKLSATAKEAVADVQFEISQEEAAQAGSGAPGSRTRQWGDRMSPKVLWDVVRAAAARAAIDKLAPHDLRRTCARLCHLAGGELDQIQFLLGTSPSRRPNATSDANRSSGLP